MGALSPKMKMVKPKKKKKKLVNELSGGKKLVKVKSKKLLDANY